MKKKLHVKILKNLIVLINDMNFLESQAFFLEWVEFIKEEEQREKPLLCAKKNFQKTPGKITVSSKINFREKN